MRPLLALSLVALASVVAPGSASAQGAVVGAVEFSPATFAPGEAVTAYAALDPGASPWFAESIVSRVDSGGEPGGPDGGLSDDAPRVLSAAVEKRSGRPVLVVRFAAWRAGPGFLPEMKLGGLSIPRIRFDCSSVLAAADARAPEPFPQLDPP
ncbi:MAG: hypothetical protein KKA67_12135, partial [Spirochaetes bacterium]|nr:hypothetical protein [Spirochaetota bacterium]